MFTSYDFALQLELNFIKVENLEMAFINKNLWSTGFDVLGSEFSSIHIFQVLYTRI